MGVLLAAPILITLTLLVSGLAKLGARQGTQEAMVSLRIPLRPLHPLAAALLPPAEVLLALLLWVPVPTVQVLVSVLVLALILAYLVIIARALTFEEQVDCSCFGTLASPTVTRSTLGRNLVLTVLAGLTVVAALRGDLAAAMLDGPAVLLGLGVSLLLAVLLTALTLGGLDGARGAASAQAPQAVGASAPAGPATGAPGGEQSGEGAEVPGEDGLLDYERTDTPAAVVQRPDGSLVSLRRLTESRAALLVFATEGCGPCERVLDQAEGWISSLSPYLQVHFVFGRPASLLRERTLARVGETTLYDPESIALSVLGAYGSPSAVLLGADGQLAGGPVRGGTAVIEFVTEIQEQLAAAREAGELG